MLDCCFPLMEFAVENACSVLSSDAGATGQSDSIREKEGDHD